MLLAVRRCLEGNSADLPGINLELRSWPEGQREDWVAGIPWCRGLWADRGLLGQLRIVALSHAERELRADDSVVAWLIAVVILGHPVARATAQDLLVLCVDYYAVAALNGERQAARYHVRASAECAGDALHWERFATSGVPVCCGTATVVLQGA